MNAVSDRDPTLHDLIRILNRRRQIVLIVAVSVFALSVAACIFTTRRYQATSIIQLQTSSVTAVDLTGLKAGSPSETPDSLLLTVELQTQANILQSDSLALKVIKDLNLEKNADFAPKFSLLGWVLGLVSPKGAPEPAGLVIDDSPGRRKHALQVFKGQLKVGVIAGTRIIEVDYVNRDPKVAAEVVNHLVQALIDYSFQTKFTATNEVSRWLESQLSDLRKQTENLQTKVVALQQSSGIFGAGGTDLQGKPIVYSPVLDRLAGSTSQLSQAKMNRILKASILKVIKTDNAELISQLSGTTLGIAGNQGVTDALSSARSLRVQEASLRAQVEKDASQFGPAYPKLVEERAALKEVQKALQDEIDRIAARAKNDYDVAVQAETGAQSTYDQDHREAEKMNDKSIEYAIVSKEANESQALYQDLLKRLKEAGILEGLHSSNLTVIDHGAPPSNPNKPQVLLYLMLGMVLGPFFGCCSALLVNAIDDRVGDREDISSIGMPFLGSLARAPLDEIAQVPVCGADYYSSFGEGIRTLRSTLRFAGGNKPSQVVLIASCNPNEGKTTVALNLAFALAQTEKKVLLVEADLRRPELAKHFELDPSIGLSTVLSGKAGVGEAVRRIAKQSNLFLLAGGMPSKCSSELLSTERMHELLEAWKSEFDYIVIDSPPLLPVTDSQIIASMSDVAFLIARAEKTTRTALKHGCELLGRYMRSPEVCSIGIVLNCEARRSLLPYRRDDYYSKKENAR